MIYSESIKEFRKLNILSKPKFAKLFGSFFLTIKCFKSKKNEKIIKIISNLLTHSIQQRIEIN